MGPVGSYFMPIRGPAAHNKEGGSWVFSSITMTHCSHIKSYTTEAVDVYGFLLA